MLRECIEALIDTNREIEFEYEGKSYSITYYNDNRKKYISVCEFNKDPIDLEHSYDVCDLTIGDLTLEEIFRRIPDDAFTIY